MHSGGMDSSICLAYAVKKFGADAVLSIGFQYGQRHSGELEKAQQICAAWQVDHTVLKIDFLQQITENSLLNHNIPMSNKRDMLSNALVVGRNGLMARIAAIHAQHLQASEVYLGVIGVEEANSGYRDCSRSYMDKLQDILRIDLASEEFSLKTPLVHMTKKETMDFANELGVLRFLLENTISCYEGLPNEGCMVCPACFLRNEGIHEYIQDNPSFEFSFKKKILHRQS